MKKIEDGTNRWKDIPFSWNGRVNIIKITIRTKANAIPIKIQMEIFHRTIKNNSKICMETQKTNQPKQP